MGELGLSTAETLALAVSLAGLFLGSVVAGYLKGAGGSTKDKLATGAASFASLRTELAELRDRVSRIEGRQSAWVAPIVGTQTTMASPIGGTPHTSGQSGES